MLEELGEIGDHDVGAVLQQSVRLIGSVYADDEAKMTGPPCLDSGERVLEYCGLSRSHAEALREHGATVVVSDLAELLEDR